MAKIPTWTCRSVSGGIFLTDGGMETTLIFHDGIDLPHFAAFVLLDTAEGREQLKPYYEALSRGRRASTAPASCSTARHGAPIRIGAHKLGYDAAALQGDQRRVDRIPGRLARGLGDGRAPCVISGAIGPRGDGYKAGNMDADGGRGLSSAADRGFVEGGADMVTRLYAEQHQ